MKTGGAAGRVRNAKKGIDDISNLTQAARAMRFREYVDTQQLSQVEVARRSGLSLSTVHRAYHGRAISYEHVRLLVLFCGGSVSYEDFSVPSRRRRRRVS